MKKYQNRKNMIQKTFLTMVLCTSIVLSNLGGAVVYATENTSEDATTAQATTAEGTTQAPTTQAPTTEASTETNVDANGKLGKNSDVGIEVAQSITGVPGSAVPIVFTLTSGNPNTIRLKDVYPAIDASFPFETSGDAYKVTAAVDEATQLRMDAGYNMVAQSNLESGYHSIRFICEYTKLKNDGSLEDYYVIKTINIYFGSAPTTQATTEKAKKTTTEKEETYDNPLDENDYSYDGGGSGSDSGESAGPKLIITGYDANPEKIMAGDTFKLTVHIQNTSKSVNVCNGKFMIGNEAGNFLPTSGSPAVFVESIPAGETGDIEIELKTSSDMAQKNYILVVKGDFDDGKGNEFSYTDNLYLPVYQEVKLAITDVSTSPQAIGVGAEGSLMFTINNQGSAGIYNVNVTVKDDAATAPQAYVGNIAGNSNAYATLELTGVADNTEKGTVHVEISYEDSEGNTETIEQDVACLIGEDVSMYDEFYDDEDYEEYEEDGLPLWAIVLIVIAALAVVGGIVTIVILKKRKKKITEDEDMDELDELDDLDGEDDSEDEDF